MKARLYEYWNGHAPGDVLEHVQPGTGPGLIPRSSAEWFDDDEEITPKPEKAAKAKDKKK